MENFIDVKTWLCGSKFSTQIQCLRHLYAWVHILPSHLRTSTTFTP